MTQSCSCCRCQKWCSANVCFAGLRKQNTKAHFAGIEFSADSPLLSKEAKPSSSHTILSTSDSDGDTDPSTALAKSYDFVQKKSKFGFHPQIGVPPIKPIVQQPQTKQPGAFTTRFHCVDVKSTPHVSLGLDSSLSVYREESTTPLNGARDSKDTAIIQFSLHYDVAQSKLTIHLQHATNLPRMCDTNGYPVQCDPLVVLHLEPERGDTLQSQVVKCTYNPVFNEMFYFRGLSRDHLRYQVLVFRIYNGALSNRAIGKASLPLVDVDLLGIVLQMIVRTKEVEPNSNYQGDLLISLSYSPRSCKLEGIIHKATGLKKCDKFGLSDPFVKVKIMFKGKRVFKWRTSVKHRTLNPVYNESFSYEVTNDMRMTMDVEGVTISFGVVDHDLLMPNDKMGYVSVGKHAGTKLGREHWNEVLKSPRHRISFWHPIQLATAAQKCQMRSRCASPVPPESH